MHTDIIIKQPTPQTIGQGEPEIYPSRKLVSRISLSESASLSYAARSHDAACAPICWSIRGLLLATVLPVRRVKHVLGLWMASPCS